MAERFVRVDLSDSARDFRPIAVEPGVPLLDRSNANSRILFKWLGGLAADAEWEEESVSFFVRDDDGGRLEEVVCQPASDEDLKGPLKEDMDALAERIAKAKPESSTERAVHKIVSHCFANLAEDENRTDRDNYFFKYRDVLGRWRLVWCWGYQRVDLEPAATLICTDPDCGLLFVRRPGQKAKCPSCEAALPTGPKKKKRPPRRKRALFVGLLLLLLACLVAYWFLNRNRLTPEPRDWTGRVGNRVVFTVKKGWLFGRKEVSREAVAVVADPRVIRFDDFGCSAVARSPGKTLVHFYLAGRSTTATVTVTPAENPNKISIQPESVELGVGTTAHLKVIGEYDDGTTADLTDAAEWEPKNDGVVFAHGGFLEGLGEGTSTVHVRYRAGPEDEYREASANVTVSEIEFTSLEMAVDPDPVPVGRGSRLRVDAVSKDGKKYSVLESSLLELGVEPYYLATVRGTHVEGNHAGHGQLAATFNGQLTGSREFDVALGAGIDSLVVAPEQLDMVVGEVTDLSIASPSREPISVTSSDSKVVEVTWEDRLIARSVGSAQVEIGQAGVSRTVDVAVTSANVDFIAIRPSSVVVPVDHRLPVRVVGRIDAGRNIELAPDLVTCEKKPSPRYADFDPRFMEVQGISPTDESSPQSLALRFKKLLAEAPVEVVIAPLRLELTPSGNVDLPLGQAMAIDAWANYRGGYRVQVLSDRVDWHSDPPGRSTPGLELRGNKVAALEAGAGPLAVWGTYLGRDSDRVTFKSVEAGPVKLKLEVDRDLRLSNEPGRVILFGTGPRGDVELVPELATFESSDSEIVNVDAASGTFRAGKPGDAVISAKHAASSEPASVKLTVVDPADARLAFEPRALKVAVDEIARLELLLQAKVGDEVRQARMIGPGVSYSIERPDAVRWHAPTLVGLSPADQFEMTASYLPYLLRPAAAKVEVVAAGDPTAVRVVPSEAPLAAGQMLSLSVEAQWPGGQQWREVRPGAVAWEVPPGPVWSPATDSLRPALTLPAEAEGSYHLTARYGGKEAGCEIATVEPTLDPADPDVELVLRREPEGRYLPVGTQQRYSIILKKGSQEEPAADIIWPSDFENDYVRWKAPVLTAKQAGYEQWLRALPSVGDRRSPTEWAVGRTVLWQVYTIDPFRPGEPPPRREDQPEEVVIVSDQGPAVHFPVGARFGDFRIEARYADGFTRMVTKKATMTTDAGFLDAPVSFSDGRMIGVRPGQTVVHADFDGVPTKKGLQVTVTEDFDLDTIRLAPAPVSILPGETIAMDAEGFKDDKSIGVITGVGGLEWESDNEEVVGVAGPAVTGRKLGQGNVTARFGSVTSEPAKVSVVDSIDADLVVDQDVIQMRVGESRRLGTDLVVRRGDVDFSRQCEVTPALPNVVRYVPQTRSLVGMSPGASAVTFAWGDKLATTTVQVLPGASLEGEVVVEPATAVLSPGQALEMRVFVLTKEGLRIDRTDSAVLSSASPGNVAIQGTRACAVATGTSEITATLPEAAEPGKALLMVDDQPITDLAVEPSQLAMSVGDLARLRILGTSASGTHELFAQPDLAVAAGGEDPLAIRIVGSDQVDAVAPGNAEVAVRWQDRLSRQVPVAVGSDPWIDLRIDPPRATIHPGQDLLYQVTGTRAQRRRVLGPEDGVQLFTGQQDVAVGVGGMFVRGTGAGRTDVVAQVGAARAEAVLNVVPGSVVIGEGGTGVTPVAPGYGYIGGDYVIHHGRRYVYREGVGYVLEGDGGEVWVGGGTHVVDVPPALGVAGLRFVPDVVRMGTNSPGARVRVMEVLADGSLGRDVSSDPGLEFNVTGEVASVDRTAEGPVIRPIGPGQTRVAARLGSTLFAEPELLVQVGDVPTGLARLDVSPDPLDLWSGEARALTSVTVTPSPGEFPIDVSYSITVPPNQNVVTAEPDGRIRGLSSGVAQVVIRVDQPGTAYDGLSTTAIVQVTGADRVWIEPAEASVRVGETTPRFAMMAQGADGRQYEVPATLESMDTNILRPEGLLPGQFVATSLGGTQVRAVYRGREAFATVTVTGQRFVGVNTKLNEGQQDFSVTIEVLAANSEGPLEYRTYAAGQTPPDVWVPAQPHGDYRRVELESPRIQYGPRSARYSLTIEARSTESGTVQRYPFTFRLAPKLEKLGVMSDELRDSRLPTGNP